MPHRNNASVRSTEDEAARSMLGLRRVVTADQQHMANDPSRIDTLSLPAGAAEHQHDTNRDKVRGGNTIKNGMHLTKYTAGRGCHMTQNPKPLYHCTVIDDSTNAREDSSNSSGGATSGSASVRVMFPEKLQQILANPIFSQAIYWAPHGKAWRILDRKLLETHVLPLYFKHAKSKSFMKQVNLWNFDRIKRAGPDYGFYTHELFCRDRPELCRRMVRKIAKSTANIVRTPPTSSINNGTASTVARPTTTTTTVVLAPHHQSSPTVIGIRRLSIESSSTSSTNSSSSVGPISSSGGDHPNNSSNSMYYCSVPRGPDGGVHYVPPGSSSSQPQPRHHHGSSWGHHFIADRNITAAAGGGCDRLPRNVQQRPVSNVNGGVPVSAAAAAPAVSSDRPTVPAPIPDGAGIYKIASLEDLKRIQQLRRQEEVAIYRQLMTTSSNNGCSNDAHQYHRSSSQYEVPSRSTLLPPRGHHAATAAAREIVYANAPPSVVDHPYDGFGFAPRQKQSYSSPVVQDCDVNVYDYDYQHQQRKMYASGYY